MYEAKTAYKGRTEDIKCLVKRNKKKTGNSKKRGGGGERKKGQKYSNVGKMARKAGRQNGRITCGPSGSIIF